MAKRAARSDGRSPGQHFDDAAMRGLSPCGRLVISTITLSPSFAPCAKRAAISTEYQCPGSSGSTRPWPYARVPDAADPLGRIADAADQARDSAPALVHADGQHLDRDRCASELAVSARASSSGAEPSSGITSTSPLERPRTRPASRSASPAVANPFGPSIACPSRTIAARRLARASRSRVGAHPEALREARRGQRLGRLREVLEQELAARDRMRVALLLELEIRILGAPIARLVARLVGIRPGLLWRARIFAAAACHGLEIPRNRKMRAVNSFAPLSSSRPCDRRASQ